MTLIQEPGAGEHLVKYAGDVLKVSLGGLSDNVLRAYVRTDFGRMDERRRAIVAATEDGGGEYAGGWHDVEMEREDDSAVARFRLSEVGVFEFKAYAVMQDGRREWVPGSNLRVKVEPAKTIAFNSIYNAFIRQFGPNISGGGRSEEAERAEGLLNSRGYTVIPPSGTFSSFRDKLDFIFDTLGFRIVMFLPVHPAPASYARMGRFGSVFAPLDFYTVDSSMAVFDRSATPIGQFEKVIDDIHSRHGLVFMDLPLDHTGWASVLQSLHPEYFKRNADGSFESPGAWGISWDDLCKLDFSDKRLWREMAEVLIHWCRMGADGFRCDAGYMIPADAWEYMTAKTRLQYPETIFLLEGLGGSVEVTRALLESGSMNWAYSESFQQFGFGAEKDYLGRCLESYSHAGLLVNFAETHDNSRLAAVSSAWAVQRTASAALLAPAGAFGMANGVEWLATEKIDVHDDSSLNWGAKENIVGLVGRLNELLAYHPCFSGYAKLSFLPSLQGEVIGLLRQEGVHSVLVLVNPDGSNEKRTSWKRCEFDCGPTAYELVSGKKVDVECHGGEASLVLPPGMVVCLDTEEFAPRRAKEPFFLVEQERRCSAMRLLDAISYSKPFDENTIEMMAGVMENGLARFIDALAANTECRKITRWDVARDSRRVVMLPQGNVLALACGKHFSAELRRNGQTMEKHDAMTGKDGIHFAFFTSFAQLHDFGKDVFEVVAKEYSEHNAIVHRGCLMPLSGNENRHVHTRLEAKGITSSDCGLCANSIGACSIARAAWGTIQSKYDALLAANCAVSYPSDRMAALLRSRIWLRFRDFSTELSLRCQRFFEASYDDSLAWEFKVPCGLGLVVSLRVTWQLDTCSNSGRLFLEFDDCGKLSSEFAGDSVTLVMRPDVDFRSVHGVSKAYAVESQWDDSVRTFGDGFDFMPDDAACLHVRMQGGAFHRNTEWNYSVQIPIDQERGLENCMDLFSPGYFEYEFKGRKMVCMEASVGRELSPSVQSMRPVTYGPLVLGDSLLKGMKRFLVRRDGHKTVIAGFPWFLDWGRDTLICLRGYIAAGMFDVAKEIICLFAQFEKDGTLPNMIRGNDTSDRDTSDAPLWLYVVVDDYIAATGDADVLKVECGGRRLGRILESMAFSLWNAAANGVRADKETALLYSPPHFTWMDTNYPAGTPREGYPVEIQALWIHATEFLVKYSGIKDWEMINARARESFLSYFRRPNGKGLCDCLHCRGFASARTACPDDACRPNQLLAVTLGALEESKIAESVLDSCAPLLTPAGIRSLDDAPVKYPLPVVDNGNALNDPLKPYWGHYSGYEDTRRKPAYHNGTSWGWQMPLWCEADYILHGEKRRHDDLAIISSAANVMEHGCLGFIPEIYDGDAPHDSKGCIAQAWSMTEFFRVMKLLQS